MLHRVHSLQDADKMVSMVTAIWEMVSMATALYTQQTEEG